MGTRGARWMYAYKLSDARFLHRERTRTSATLAGFASGTPRGPLLEMFALPYPVLAGVGVAVVEIAIGLLALVGRFTQIVAE